MDRAAVLAQYFGSGMQEGLVALLRENGGK